jgi:hypothetical protein
MHSTCSVPYNRARTVALGTKELVDFTTWMHGWLVGKGGVLGYGQNLQSPDPHTQTKFSNLIQTSNQLRTALQPLSSMAVGLYLLYLAFPPSKAYQPG